jgi:diacylglycerol O-acyltransferase
MYRLHGQDATWLYKETLTTPMHTLKIFLLELGPDEPLDLESVRKSVPRLLHEVPILRQRPVFIPMGLHHPVMIEDPEFDLNYHLNRAAVPAPGGISELEEVLAQIASHPLDQDRPLWQFWIIEGLENGRIALVQKIHHAVADGMASLNSMTRVWHSSQHDPDSVPQPWVPESIPSNRRLLCDALLDHFKYDIGNLPSFFKAIYRLKWGIKKPAGSTPSPTLKSMNGELPRTRWNRALSSRRSFATAQLDLEELKAVKNELGGTLNDVVLALMAGSLREFLLFHDELPDEPLVATVPVSTDAKGSEREAGNATTVMLTMLYVQNNDPVERYHATRAATELGKSELNLVGRDTFALLAHYLPPVLQRWIANRAYRKRLADSKDFRPPANLTVSNVPGPQQKFSTQGNVVEDIYSSGPLIEGIGLNITVWSYAGKMNFTATGCIRALPDIHKITAGLKDALLQLQDAAGNSHKTETD